MVLQIKFVVVVFQGHWKGFKEAEALDPFNKTFTGVIY